MRRNFVQEHQRRDAFDLPDQLGFGEDKPDQKRLLLARGAVLGRCIFGPVTDN